MESELFLTLMLAGMFIVVGTLRACMAFQNHGFKNWVWPFINGMISVILGIIILFAEAQTSGGLLAAVKPDQVESLVNVLKEHGDTESTIIGRVEKQDDPAVFLETE